MNLRHHRLVAWQRADDLFITLHQLATKQFPDFERFELSRSFDERLTRCLRILSKDSRDGIGAYVCIS